MAINAQCGSCSARYKIVDTASGRRVKCRKCGNPFYVPGEPITIAPVTNLAGLTELEKTATPAQTQQSALIQYKAAVSVIAAPPAAPKRRGGSRQKLGEGTSIHDLAPHGKFTEAKGPKRRGGGGVTSSPLMLGAIVCAGLLAGSWYVPMIGDISFKVCLALAVGGVAAGAAWGVTRAFLDDAIQGTLCLLVPFYYLYYVATHWEEMKQPFFLQLGGVFMFAMAAGTRLLGKSGPNAAHASQPGYTLITSETPAASSRYRLVLHLAQFVSDADELARGSVDHFEHLRLLVGGFARLEGREAQSQRAPFPPQIMAQSAPLLLVHPASRAAGPV